MYKFTSAVALFLLSTGALASPKVTFRDELGAGLCPTAGGEAELLLPRSSYVRFNGSEIKMLDLFTEEGWKNENLKSFI